MTRPPSTSAGSFERPRTDRKQRVFILLSFLKTSSFCLRQLGIRILGTERGTLDAPIGFTRTTDVLRQQLELGRFTLPSMQRSPFPKCIMYSSASQSLALWGALGTVWGHRREPHNPVLPIALPSLSNAQRTQMCKSVVGILGSSSYPLPAFLPALHLLALHQWYLGPGPLVQLIGM